MNGESYRNKGRFTKKKQDGKSEAWQKNPIFSDRQESIFRCRDELRYGADFEIIPQNILDIENKKR